MHAGRRGRLGRAGQLRGGRHLPSRLTGPTAGAAAASHLRGNTMRRRCSAAAAAAAEVGALWGARACRGSWLQQLLGALLGDVGLARSVQVGGHGRVAGRATIAGGRVRCLDAGLHETRQHDRRHGGGAVPFASSTRVTRRQAGCVRRADAQVQIVVSAVVTTWQPLRSTWLRDESPPPWFRKENPSGCHGLFRRR
eukprot:363873-Chlamydomonas_euryale.AAC.9